MTRSTRISGRQTPLRTLLVLAVAAFGAETFVMFLLFYILSTPAGFRGWLMDATLDVLLLSPVLYFSVVRPMARTIIERERATAELRKAHEELEVRIKERTAELAAANRRLEDEIAVRRRAETELQESFQEQRRFLADASHELRTPLTIIRGEAELALRGPEKPPGQYRESLEGIVGVAEHMGRVINDLLFLARSRVGQVAYQMAELELAPLLEAVHNQSRCLAATKGVNLKLALDGSLAVSGDAQRLSQLFMILLDNGIKYTPAGGEVGLSLGNTSGSVRVSVSDTGVGIPPSELPHIFERFYQGESQSAGGTGLGLAIAKAIAEAHQGKISVVSNPGKGTTFTVFLPLAERPSPRPCVSC